jgi:hypothetical protein
MAKNTRNPSCWEAPSFDSLSGKMINIEVLHHLNLILKSHYISPFGRGIVNVTRSLTELYVNYVSNKLTKYFFIFWCGICAKVYHAHELSFSHPLKKRFFVFWCRIYAKCTTPTNFHSHVHYYNTIEFKVFRF